jgi:hypothetical protein
MHYVEHKAKIIGIFLSGRKLIRYAQTIHLSLLLMLNAAMHIYEKAGPEDAVINTQMQTLHGKLQRNG